MSLTSAFISFSCGSSINRCSVCGSLSAVFEPENDCLIPSSLAGTSSRLLTAIVDPDLGSVKSWNGGVLPPIEVSCSPLYFRPYCLAMDSGVCASCVTGSAFSVIVFVSVLAACLISCLVKRPAAFSLPAAESSSHTENNVSSC